VKKIGMNLLKALCILAFVIGLLSFTRSLAPERNETQKVYDDFVKDLNRIYVLPQPEITDSAEEIIKQESIRPSVLVEFVIKENNEPKVLRTHLNWNDPDSLKKDLRILDLLQLANIFSKSSAYDSESADIVVRVVGASGYKFESLMKAEELKSNSPLNLALVLMRERAS
jgi:hypothetical protein